LKHELRERPQRLPSGVAARPDLDVVADRAGRPERRVVAGGRDATAERVRAAFAAGARAAVVGAAITDPVARTRRFAAATPIAAGGAPGGGA